MSYAADAINRAINNSELEYIDEIKMLNNFKNWSSVMNNIGYFIYKGILSKEYYENKGHIYYKNNSNSPTLDNKYYINIELLIKVKFYPHNSLDYNYEYVGSQEGATHYASTLAKYIKRDFNLSIDKDNEIKVTTETKIVIRKDKEMEDTIRRIIIQNDSTPYEAMDIFNNYIQLFSGKTQKEFGESDNHQFKPLLERLKEEVFDTLPEKGLYQMILFLPGKKLFKAFSDSDKVTILNILKQYISLEYIPDFLKK